VIIRTGFSAVQVKSLEPFFAKNNLRML
jgi:hypothetical protein